MKPCPASFTVVVALVLVALGAAGSDAHAQAWVEDKGTLAFSLDYNLGISDEVLGDQNIKFPDAGTTTHQFTLAGEYVLVDRLAVEASLPLALFTYTGSKTLYPHPGGGSYDDGNLHTTLTDLRVGARYQLLEDPVAISPHIGVSIPVASYETVGNTVAGRHLKALHLGAGIGRVFGEATYVHLLYEFSLVEKYDRTPNTQLIGQNRSDFTFTIGHKFLDQRLDIHADANGRVTHGGVNFSQLDAGTVAADDVMFHDPLLAESILLAGGGVGYQIASNLGINAGARLFLTGSNTQNASVYVLGVTWTAL